MIGNLAPDFAYPEAPQWISPVREALKKIGAGLAPPLRLGSVGSPREKGSQVPRPRGRNNTLSAASTAEHGGISFAEIRRTSDQLKSGN